MSNVIFQKQGLTTFISANASGVLGNITVANGPAAIIKVDNINNANVDAFLNWSTVANTATATIANTTTPGNSVCIQHNSTEFIRVQGPGTTAGQLFFSAITASGTANIYITPVAIVS